MSVSKKEQKLEGEVLMRTKKAIFFFNHYIRFSWTDEHSVY